MPQTNVKHAVRRLNSSYPQSADLLQWSIMEPQNPFPGMMFQDEAGSTDLLLPASCRLLALSRPAAFA
jgi:hypothetical protein